MPTRPRPGRHRLQHSGDRRPHDHAPSPLPPLDGPSPSMATRSRAPRPTRSPTATTPCFSSRSTARAFRAARACSTCSRQRNDDSRARPQPDGRTASAAIALGGGGGHVVSGNFIGTDAAGARALPNDTGIRVSSANNLIGGDFPAARNLISGNAQTGISWRPGRRQRRPRQLHRHRPPRRRRLSATGGPA